MKYHIIYDGDCNLCVTFTQILEKFDDNNLFDYTPMQDSKTLQEFAVTTESCELGVILIDGEKTNKRWQGSDAIEEIVRLLPTGDLFISFYRNLPGMKLIGDRTYQQIRDRRYALFGKRNSTYYSKKMYNIPSCKNPDL